VRAVDGRPRDLHHHVGVDLARVLAGEERVALQEQGIVISGLQRGDKTADGEHPELAVPATQAELDESPGGVGVLGLLVDAVLGHGPHVLRGVEIYKGKPIFYSLGNFIQQLENVRFQPAEFYERYGLDPDAPLQEAWDAFTQKDTRGFAPEAPFWESVLASFTFQEGQLNQIKLYPITLGFGKPRSQRGLPLLAEPKLGRKIIDDMIRLSAPYGTQIEFRDGVGVVTL